MSNNDEHQYDDFTEETLISVPSDYFIPNVDYPTQVVRLLAYGKRMNIISADTYINDIHPLVQIIYSSPLMWEMCAEFWKMFWSTNEDIVESLSIAIMEWDK